MSEAIHIVRFIPLRIAFRVISAYSTFALTNSIHFRHLEEQDRDEKENIVEFEDRRRSYELGATTLITCWTKLTSDSLSEADWDIVRDAKTGIAIVSTVESVRAFLDRETKHILDKPVWLFEHRDVTYYDGLSHPPVFDTMKDPPFWKRKKFEHEREYRFAFLSSSIRNIDNLIFYTWEPKAYIKTISFGPCMDEKAKRRLVAQAIEAKLVGLIEHFDDIYRSPA